MGAGYTREQRRALRAALKVEDRPACPACGGLVSVRPLARPPVAYVRRRVVLVCGDCGRTAAVDVDRMEGGAPRF